MARSGREPVLTEDTKIDLVLKRFAPMFEGRPPSDYNDLAKAVGVSAKTVQRAISEAFANGWVEIRKVSPGYRRVTRLEEKLLKKFANKGKLETAIVVSHPDLGQDFAHECLGAALADEIIGGGAVRKMFRDRDRIALGTGRGVHFVAESLLKRREQLRRSEGIRLVSLTGRIFPTITTDVDPADGKYNFSDNFADADTNISMMARVFDRVSALCPIVHPIAHDPGRRNSLLDAGALQEQRFKDHVPNHAIAGFGVLDRNHRLFREVSLIGQDSPTLGSVRHYVEELVSESANYQKLTGFGFPVGDVCNRFFLIKRKLTGNTQATAIMQKLSDYVDSLQKCLITVTKTQLGMIPNLMILGAGREKAHILHFLLSGTTPAQPHIVVTDEQCAEDVLKMADDIYATEMAGVI